MTDQPDPAERRTRYAAAMAVRDGDTWPTTYENDEADYLRRADAAMAVADAEMAVLPAPVDRAAVLREAADVIVADNDRQMWATKPGKHWAADLLRRMADEAQQPEEVPAPQPAVCEGFQWIGQSFAICDRCGQPAWEHAGEELPAEGAGLFDTRWTVRPWKPGEADAIRAKWARPAP